MARIPPDTMRSATDCAAAAGVAITPSRVWVWRTKSGQEHEGLYFAAVYPLADLLRVDVEGGHDLHPVAAEFFIPQEGAAQAAGADENGLFGPVPAEKVLDPVDQVDERIADSRFADNSGHFDIFTDLGGVQAEDACKVGAGDLGHTGDHHLLQATVVDG